MGIFQRLHEAADSNSKHAKQLAYAHAMAKHTSHKEGVVQHVNKNDHDDGHHVSDWYDHEKTVATYNKGKLREATDLTIDEAKQAPARPGDTIHYKNDAGHNQKEVVSHSDLDGERYGVTANDGKKYFVHRSQVHHIDRTAGK